MTLEEYIRRVRTRMLWERGQSVAASAGGDAPGVPPITERCPDCHIPFTRVNDYGYTLDCGQCGVRYAMRQGRLVRYGQVPVPVQEEGSPSLPPTDRGIDGVVSLPPMTYEPGVIVTQDPAALPWHEQNRRINDLLMGRTEQWN